MAHITCINIDCIYNKEKTCLYDTDKKFEYVGEKKEMSTKMSIVFTVLENYLDKSIILLANIEKRLTEIEIQLANIEKNNGEKN